MSVTEAHQQVSLPAIERHDAGNLDRFWKRTRPAVAIVALGALFRVVLYIACTPWWCGDSGGYTGVFYWWVRGIHQNGGRPPLYPIFLGLTQWLAKVPAGQAQIQMSAAYVTVVLQSLLTLSAGVMVFYLLRHLRVREWLAFGSALLFVCNPVICEFELCIVTQSLSLFTLVTGMWLLARAVTEQATTASSVSRIAVAGLVLGLSVLARAENLIPLVVFSAFAAVLWITHRQHASGSLFGKVALVLPISGLAIVGPLMAWNYLGTGEFRIVATGHQVSQAVYNLFGRVDPEDRVLGQIMSKYYAIYNSGSNVRRDYIWSAEPEIQAYAAAGFMPLEDPLSTPPANGLVAAARNSRRRINQAFGMQESPRLFVILDNYIGKVSWKLARKYPGDWLQNAADKFIHDTFRFNFLQPPVYPIEDPRSPEGGGVVRNPRFWKLVGWGVAAEAPVLTAAYVTTLLLALVAPVILSGHSNQHFVRDAYVAVLAVACTATFVAHCVFGAYYFPYGVPYIGALLVCTTYAVENAPRALRALGWSSRGVRSGPCPSEEHF